MSDRHATTADLPGWNTVDTVLGLSQRPGTHGWVQLQDSGNPREQLQPVGRDMAGRLYAASGADFAGNVSRSAVELGYLALLVGVEDGIALWLPPNAYHHIKPVDPDEPGEQPDVPRWLPIREVLQEPLAEAYENLSA